MGVRGMRWRPEQAPGDAGVPPGRGDELTLLLEASRAALERTDLDGALRTILDAALRLLGAEEGSIQLLDRRTNTLSIAAGRGLPAEAMREHTPVGQGIAGHVAATARPVLLASAVDVERFPGYQPKGGRRIHAALSLPLSGRDGVIGVLNLNRTAPGAAFDDRDLRLGALFAEHAAQALENARLLARTERHAAELESLRGAALRLSSSLEVSAVAEAALQEAMTLAGAEAGFLCVAGESGGLELATFKGLSRGRVRDALARPAFQALLRDAEPRLVRDVAADPVLAPLAGDVSGSAVVVLPLGAGPARLAALLAVAPPPGREPAAMRLLSTFAIEAGLALANAVLYRNLSSKQGELEAIVSSVDIPIVLVGADGTLRAVNRTASEVFGLAPEFEIGQPVRGKLGEPLDSMVLDTAECTADLTRAVGGETRAYRARATSISSGPREGSRLLVLTDMSAQRELEQRKADFLAVIGHELRTPLTNIRGYASTLAKRGDDVPPNVRQLALETILSQTERLERLIEDLLLVSRIETKRPPLHLGWDDVVEIVEEIVEEMQRRAPERVIDLRAPHTPLPILTDRLKIEQVLVHLIDNALKFSDTDKPVEVTVTPGDEAIEIAVRDRGIGIFSGDVPRLFRSFGQLDASSTRRHGGTGVGLSICKSLLDMLGGRIWVKTALGKGSTFTVRVPRRSEEPEDAAAP